MSKILIIRLSAMGDVAMTIPVIYAAAAANPKDSFTVLTETSLMTLFINHPTNINVMGVNTKTTEKSFLGFLRYIWKLRKYQFEMVLDLHGVIRSHMVDFLFRLNGRKVFTIDKRRKERKRLTALPPKIFYPLRPVTACYADVFRAAGFSFEETFVSLYANTQVNKDIGGEKKGHWIGIAPFAKHSGKIYPVEKMEQVVEALSKQVDVTVFLLGGRGDEEQALKKWEEKYEHTRSVAGCYSLDRELMLISRLDVLVSMDSANMHLASLVTTKVISIWGATHPFAGFYGYHQREDLAIQVELPCRPCSIYGNKPCHLNDRACMNDISPEQIIHKVNDYLKAL